MCDAKIDKTGPFHAFFSHIFEKHPFFVLGRFYPPLRVYARIRARLEKTPLYTRFLVTHGYQSRTRVAPPPPGVKIN